MEMTEREICDRLAKLRDDMRERIDSMIHILEEGADTREREDNPLIPNRKRRDT